MKEKTKKIIEKFDAQGEKQQSERHTCANGNDISLLPLFLFFRGLRRFEVWNSLGQVLERDTKTRTITGKCARSTLLSMTTRARQHSIAKVAWNSPSLLAAVWRWVDFRRPWTTWGNSGSGEEQDVKYRRQMLRRRGKAWPNGIRTLSLLFTVRGWTFVRWNRATPRRCDAMPRYSLAYRSHAVTIRRFFLLLVTISISFFLFLFSLFNLSPWRVGGSSKQ